MEHYRSLLEKYQRELLGLMIMLLIAIGMVMFFFDAKEEPSITVPKSHTAFKNNSAVGSNPEINKSSTAISGKGSPAKEASKKAAALDYYNQLPLRNPFQPPLSAKSFSKGGIKDGIIYGNQDKIGKVQQTGVGALPNNSLLKLKGIINYKGKWTALLEYEGRQYSCCPGEKLGPYQIILVSEQHLQLKQGQELLQLKL